MRELNSLEARRGRKPLDVNNVIYWFKNTRAAVKRTEMKTRALQGGWHRFIRMSADRVHAIYPRSIFRTTAKGFFPGCANSPRAPRPQIAQPRKSFFAIP